MAEKGENKILVIISILIILISVGLSGCIEDDGDKNSDLKNSKINITGNINIISRGIIYGEDIYKNIIIWTEEKEDGRYLFYCNLEKENIVNFAGPITSGYTSGIYGEKIVWVKINENFKEIHLYDINKKQDEILMKDVGRTSVSPSITKDYIIWMDKTSDIDSEISTLFRYHFSNGTIDTPIKNISNYRELDIDGDIIVIIHDGYNNCTIYNMANGNEYTLEKHTVSEISLSGDRLIFQETINNPPNGGLHHSCFGSWDEIYYLYDLKTQKYKKITERETYRASPDMDNNYIVWQGNHTFESGLGGKVEQDWEIFLYDISTETEKQLINTDADEFSPVINGNSIIWSQFEKGSFESNLILYFIE